MAAFSNMSFDTSAFSVNAYDFGDGPPPPPADVAQAALVGGGIPAHGTLHLRRRDGRSKKEIELDRERFGIAATVIAEVAEHQAQRLEQDEQKRFDELLRELQLREIEWDARYLEALNAQRQRLIDEEIAKLLKLKTTDEEMMILMMLAACV